MPSLGMVEKAQNFGTRKIQPLSLGFVTYQMYGLGKFLNFLEPQLPGCKRASRIPTWQPYLTIKGNMSEARSTVLVPWAQRSSHPFQNSLDPCLVLPLVCPSSSFSFGFARFLSKSWLRHGLWHLSSQRLSNVSPSIIQLPFPFGLGAGLDSLIVPVPP